MRRKIILAAVLTAWGVMASAQTGWNIGLQGGGLISVNENSFSYYDASKGVKNFTWQGAFAVGYDFEKFWGLRLYADFGNNNSGYNIKDTADGKFRPFHFKGIDIFADAMLNLRVITGRREGFFQPKAYFGLGYGYTDWFANDFDGEHPWQEVETGNHSFGLRLGFQFEFKVSPVVGLYVDLCAEGYTDRYNGLRPTQEDKDSVKGYPGFPLDGKGKFSAGILFHIPTSK